MKWGGGVGSNPFRCWKGGGKLGPPLGGFRVGGNPVVGDVVFGGKSGTGCGCCGIPIPVCWNWNGTGGCGDTCGSTCGGGWYMTVLAYGCAGGNWGMLSVGWGGCEGGGALPGIFWTFVRTFDSGMETIRLSLVAICFGIDTMNPSPSPLPPPPLPPSSFMGSTLLPAPPQCSSFCCRDSMGYNAGAEDIGIATYCLW